MTAKAAAALSITPGTWVLAEPAAPLPSSPTPQAVYLACPALAGDPGYPASLGGGPGVRLYPLSLLASPQTPPYAEPASGVPFPGPTRGGRLTGWISAGTASVRTNVLELFFPGYKNPFIAARTALLAGGSPLYAESAALQGPSPTPDERMQFWVAVLAWYYGGGTDLSVAAFPESTVLNFSEVQTSGTTLSPPPDPLVGPEEGTRPALLVCLAPTPGETYTISNPEQRDVLLLAVAMSGEVLVGTGGSITIPPSPPSYALLAVWGVSELADLLP